MGNVKDLNADKVKIAVIGLGYVGLPLAVAFAKRYEVVGFDLNKTRILSLRSGVDSTQEVSGECLQSISVLYTFDIKDLRDCQCYIIAVPTPIDQAKVPDMSALKSASKLVGSCLKVGNVVVYESTVYPGATEGLCVPILAQFSNLVLNEDFFVGYSPERINPGDKVHRLETIKKVVSGSNEQTLRFLAKLYGSIIEAGIYEAPDIKTAEAAKIIENTQRDINIALMNELACLFHKMDIDTEAVLRAAETKWNFLSFRPGLVGGHCIGVDPYYLTYQANRLNFHLKMVLSGRQINDNMGAYVAKRVLRLMIKRQIDFQSVKVLIMGYTFKEDCPDCRNTRVKDVIDVFQDYGVLVHVYDPWVSVDDRPDLLCFIDQVKEQYDAIVFAVAHESFKSLSNNQIQSWKKPNGVVFDVKSMLNSKWVDERL